MKTPYDVLGISPDADEKTIAIAFREAAKRCHPDLNPGDHAAERFKQLSAARDALSNPAWRALYQYVQLKRRHDRRQWIVTIASCIVSAVVSAGLVNFLQKPLIPDPPMGPAAVSAEVDGDRHQFELVGTRANVARRENDEPTQSVAITKFQAGNEVANSGQESGRPVSRSQYGSTGSHAGPGYARGRLCRKGNEHHRHRNSNVSIAVVNGSRTDQSGF